MLPLRTFTSNPSRFSAFSMLVGDGGVHVAYDQAYGAHARQQMDVYSPKSGDAPGAPVALFLYGGSWKGGCKSCYGFVGAALARRGIVAAVADYRVYPDVSWPVFQEDAADAFRWVRANLGGNGKRPVVLIGHSAGAHMAALLATDRRWLGDDRPAALVGLSGPYTFEPTLWPTTREIFATATGPDEPRPVSYAGDHVAPTLLVHGGADIVVKSENATGFAAALSRAGVSTDIHVLPDVDHRGTVLGFARPFRRRNPVLDLTAAFVHKIAAAMRQAV